MKIITALSAETSYMDALAQAIAVRNSGGVVIVQVRNISEAPLPLGEVRIPGMLVDYVVLAEDVHPQTYGSTFDAAYTSRQAWQPPTETELLPLAKRLIIARATKEMRRHSGAHINLGIGIPALLGTEARARGWHDYTISIESGLIGGFPEEGMSFGAVRNPDAILEQSSLFDLYDGGGIDVAFLGFGEVDRQGNVNVSRLGGKLPGAGGFINISQFGIYLQSRLKTLIKRAVSRGLNIVQLHAEVVDIQSQDNRQIVSTDCNLRLIADYVFLVCGTLPARRGDALVEHPRVFSTPYPVDALPTRVPADASVGILGARLSAIDAVIALIEQGHHGPITLYSRSGYFPSPGGTFGV